MSNKNSTNKLIKYFNRFNGKSVNSSEIINGLKSEFETHENQIEAILTSDDNHDAEGTQKMCAYFGDEKVLAMLKSFKVYRAYDQENLNGKAKAIINENNKLMAEGAVIPKLYSLFFADNRYIEIQRRAVGDIIAVLNLENFSRRLLEGVNKIDAKEYQTMFAEKLFEYNFNQQQLMLLLPQEKFDELFNTYKILNNNYFGDYDSHCENVLVSKKGFMVVDIDYDQMMFNTNRLTEQNLYFRFLRPFSNATTFTKFLTPSQIESLQSNNIEILKKLVTTATNNNIELFDNENFTKVIAPQIVGKQNWKQNQSYILASQAKLLKQSYNKRKS